MAMTLDQQRAMAMAEAEALQRAQGGATPSAAATHSPAPSQQGVPPVQPAGSPPDNESTLSRYANIAGEAIPRGIATLAGTPRSLDEWANAKAHKLLPPWLADAATGPTSTGAGAPGFAPDVQQTNDWLTRQEKARGIDIPPPRNTPERLTQAGFEGLSGGMASGLPAVAGVLSGVAGEGAHEIWPKSELAPILAGMFAGGLRTPRVGQVAEDIAGSKVGRLVEGAVSPTTMDESAQRAEASIRSYRGQGNRDTAITAEQLKPFQRSVSALAPNDKLALTDYMETRSQAGKAIPPHLQAYQGVADTARDAFAERQTKLTNLPSTAQMNFITDYFPHMWKDPQKANAFLDKWYGGKEGSGRNLKERSIPTVSDGINAGLEPVTDDPIQATLTYASNMDKFIATKQVFEAGKANGDIRIVAKGQRPPSGWVPVKSFVGGGGPMNDAYAPPGFAKVYNNFVSTGFSEEAGAAYDILQKANGAVNAFNLGISAYHAATMAHESFVNDLQRSISEALGGSPLKAAKTFAASPMAPVKNLLKGREVRREYLNPGSSRNPLMRTITDLGTKANMNVTNVAKELRASALGSYWDAFRRGTLKMELAADARTAAGAPLTGTAKVFFKNTGRVLDSIAKPLFGYAIPRLKAGAFYNNMKSWMEANPAAPLHEQERMAREIWDSVDNRFGEVVHDNIFWNQMLKQTARLALRSYSWDLGTMREIGGGIKDYAKHGISAMNMKSPNYSPRAAYVPALVMGNAMIQAVQQYLHTGEYPKDIHDLIAGRTGGTDPSTHKPQRTIDPGYMKDVFGFIEHPVQEGINKLSPLGGLTGEMLTGKDWRGLPIADPNADAPTWFAQWMEHIGSSMLPFSVQQQMQGEKRGSKITEVERLLGVRSADRFMTDPQSYERMMHGIGESQWRKKERADRRQKNLYKGIE